MEEEMPTLASFCVWLYKQPKYYMDGASYTTQTIEAALRSVREFLVLNEGKAPEQASAFIDNCKHIAETWPKE